MHIEGGFPVGADGRVHTTFSHNPSTLRLASSNPNMQNIPRSATSEWARWVKDCFVAPPGSEFWAADFSGIEAVLVGYFANSHSYTRLAKIDVHSFYTAHALHLYDGRIPASDLPSLSTSDADLAAHLAAIKKEWKKERNGLYKHLVHGANYLQGPKGATDTIFRMSGAVFPLPLVTRLMDIYFEIFPDIKTWQHELCERVDRARRRKGEENETIDNPWTLGVAFAQNPFGYVHRFYHVLDWTKVGSEWISEFGDDAKRLVAFMPQSTAAAIIKRAARILWEEYPWIGETMRLLIHDEIFGEARSEFIDICIATAIQVMTSPIPELPLDPSWNMGSHLSIGVEAKRGRIWSEMK